jgi:predicted DNA-binding protein YlxM (UPF0122 family)
MTRKKDFYKKEKWLRKYYLERKLSAPEIARKCGIQKSSVYYWLAKFKIEIRSSLDSRSGKKHRKRKKPLLPYYRIQPWLYDMYVKKDMTMAEIAEICNCSEAAIRTWLIKFGINIRAQKMRCDPNAERSDGWYYMQGRIAWEEYWREPPPEGYIIHHFDHNITNWDITNLALVTREFHNTIHNFGKKKRAQIIPEVAIAQNIRDSTQVAA